MLNLCEKFNALSCKKASINDAFLHPNLRGDWYLVQINSMPQNNVHAIVSDIHLDRNIRILNGTIERYSDDEIMNINDIKSGLKQVIDSLENRIYFFLLFDNKNKSLFNGQPLIFIVDPQINRSYIPYHRHLNNGYFRVYSEKSDNSTQFLDEANLNNHHILNYQVIPESVCYIHDVEELDVDGYCRQEVAYATMVSYAFRNEIFIKFFELNREFFWLGPETPFPSFAEGHLLSVNQDSGCHCGSKSSYKDCHFEKDFKVYYNKRALTINDKNIAKKMALTIDDKNIAKKMVIETQKHFAYQSVKLINRIVGIIESTD